MFVVGGIVSPGVDGWEEPRMTCRLVSYTPGWMTLPMDLGYRFRGDNHDFGPGHVYLEIP